jgi:hypothetical protein
MSGHLVGFLCATGLPSFGGRPTVYGAEWAHAASTGDARQVYEETCSEASRGWIAARYRTHLVTTLADDWEGIEAWR